MLDTIDGLYMLQTSVDHDETTLTLSPRESEECLRMRSLSRRLAYQSSRQLGKQLLCQLSGQCPSDVEILSRDIKGCGTRPRVLFRGQPTHWQVSISHKENVAMILATQRQDIRIGCDLEYRQTLGEDFRALWFTSLEQQWLKSDSSLQSATLWAAKEAAYKALNEGEAFSPKRFEVEPIGDHKFSCHYAKKQAVCLVAVDPISITVVAIHIIETHK